MLRYEPQVVSSFRANVPVGRDPLYVGAKPGDVGAAIDIGTTTVVVMLVDLAEGRVIASASDFNRQMHFGDDVLTRINLCSTDSSMLAVLHKAIVGETIVALLKEAAQEGGIGLSQIRSMSVAGNTTMLHLFAGVDPSPMGVAPFTAGFLAHRIVPGEALGLEGCRPVIHLMPGCAAYVGADLSAGIFATGLLYDDGPAMLVDIGTNGEIILKHDGKLYGCATAAGPAFEGAGLASGMRAGDGAISHVSFALDPLKAKVEVIGGQRHVKAAGICGSGYVDFLAEGRRAGVIEENGRFCREREGVGHLLLAWHDREVAVRVAQGAGGQAVVVSERDVSKLLQAKAAIAAGIVTLLSRVGLKAKDVKTLYLAGGFGMHVSVPNAIAAGLLPGFTTSQVEVVGNTSLGGAYLTLLDRGVLDELERIRRSMTVLELNHEADFESCYIDQLMLP